MTWELRGLGLRAGGLEKRALGPCVAEAAPQVGGGGWVQTKEPAMHPSSSPPPLLPLPL
eukprot:CAMPEP_0172628924 /NCGR_PEP_ID=MMETSP1068-20121228/164635_1 /TAXON_ID=35684 /ORGANISM="Pseudopedinella elastica, Strain CCMP716" /LENGTH=58 /DNA_ID=CAMNT_0013439301 /DNA_START=50 /DNA_END=224 /DNA_ORIENTATION=-